MPSQHLVHRGRHRVTRSGRVAQADPAPGIGREAAGGGVAATGFGSPGAGDGAAPPRRKRSLLALEIGSGWLVGAEGSTAPGKIAAAPIGGVTG